jgi:23S rRNA pseudouridine2605 synthase
LAKAEGRLDELARLCCVYGYEKEYRVLLAKRPDHEPVEAWKRGVILEDGYKTQPVEVCFESAQGNARVRVISLWAKGRSVRFVRQQAIGTIRGENGARLYRDVAVGDSKAVSMAALDADEVDALKGKETKKREMKKFAAKRANRLIGRLSF